MRHTGFEKILAQALQDIPNPENHLKDTILAANLQADIRCKRKRIPFRKFLSEQVRYIGWKLWGVQGVLLFLFDRLVFALYGEKFWDSTTSAARLLFCVSTLVVMMALPILYRSRKYRMHEIEAASCFSSVRLLLAKLAVIGIGDVLMLAGIFLTTMVRTSMQAGNLTFYLLLPFLIMSAAYLYMMGHCSSGGFFVGSIALGAAMILFTVILPGRWLMRFQQSMNFGWILFCVGLLVFSAKQLRYLLCRSPYTELQVS